MSLINATLANDAEMAFQHKDTKSLRKRQAWKKHPVWAMSTLFSRLFSLVSWCLCVDRFMAVGEEAETLNFAEGLCALREASAPSVLSLSLAAGRQAVEFGPAPGFCCSV